MPTSYVKLRDTDTPIAVSADENPQEGQHIGNYDGTLVFKRGDQEIGHFLRVQVVAWWRDTTLDDLNGRTQT